MTTSRSSSASGEVAEASSQDKSQSEEFTEELSSKRIETLSKTLQSIQADLNHLRAENERLARIQEILQYENERLKRGGEPVQSANDQLRQVLEKLQVENEQLNEIRQHLQHKVHRTERSRAQWSFLPSVASLVLAALGILVFKWSTSFSFAFVVLSVSLFAAGWASWRLLLTREKLSNRLDQFRS